MKNIQTTVLALLILCLCSCNKKSYISDMEPKYLQEGSLLDHLKKDTELTQFVSLLKKTGYDSVLIRKDLYTVLAIKNGSFNAIDTNNVQELKKVIAMHILPSALAKEGLAGRRVMAISGKYVKFLESNGSITANNVNVIGTGDRATNGLAYKVDNVILSLPNLYDIISTDPKFSIFFDYIKSSYVSTFDPLNNTIIRYDSLGKPVYKQPWVLIYNSDYLKYSDLGDESEESTLFIPTNDAINAALGRLLAARGNNAQLIIPRISSVHRDTTAGGYYFSQNIPYRGDSTILKDYIFTNIIVKGSVNNLVSGINTFTSKAGNQYQVSSSQVQATTAVSNGTYYTLNDITLPDLVYRKTFMFDPRTIDPAFPVIFSNGAATTNAFVTAALNATFDRYSQFNFNNVNARMDFTFPFVTAGNYKAVLRYVPNISGGIFNSSYNGLPLKQNMNLSTLFGLNNVSVDIVLGTINVSNNGPVKITFVCADKGTLASNGFFIYMNTIKLIPVN